MKGDRTCIVCGTHYKYCPSCGKDNPTETWRFIYCSENCRDVFKTVEQFKANKLTSVQAAKALSALKMPAKIQEHIRKDIDTIFRNVVPVKEDAMSVMPEKLPTKEIPKPDTGMNVVVGRTVEVSSENNEIRHRSRKKKRRNNS